MGEAQVVEETQYCAVHPEIATSLRCNKCGRLMCTRCAVQTPVGYRCRECVKGQQKIFYTGNWTDLIIQFAVTFPLSAIAAALVGTFGGMLGIFFMFLIAIPVSTAVGAFIADLAHRAVGRRRHEWGWIVVAAGMVLGALTVALCPALFFAAYLAQIAQAQGLPPGEVVEGLGPYGWASYLMMGGFTSLGWWVYTVAGTLAAVGRLRLGGRVRFRR